MNGKHRLSIEIKSLAADGTFEGILASYNNVDLGGDSIVPGAFTKTLQERGPVVPLLWQHKADAPIGDLTLHDTPDGLMFKGRLLLDLEDAKKAYVLLKARVIKGMSIGYDTIKDTMENGVRILKEVRLWEGSVVTFPMNEACMVTGIKSKRAEMKGDFDEEYHANQLYSAAYQMYDALCTALYSVNWSDGDNASKLDAASTVIDQFKAAYLPMLTEYLDMVFGADGDMELMGRLQNEHKSYAAAITRRAKLLGVAVSQKAGRKLSAATVKVLNLISGHAAGIADNNKGITDNLAALLEDEADGDPDDPEIMGAVTPETKAAAVNTEPVVEDHSAATASLAAIRALIPKRKSGK